jgi:hypothetical protein
MLTVYTWNLVEANGTAVRSFAYPYVPRKGDGVIIVAPWKIFIIDQVQVDGITLTIVGHWFITEEDHGH